MKIKEGDEPRITSLLEKNPDTAGLSFVLNMVALIISVIVSILLLLNH